MRVNLGHVHNELGEYQENVELLPRLLMEANRLGLWYVGAVAMSNLSKAQLALGRLPEAEGSALEAIYAFAKQGDQRMEAVTRAYLAMILCQLGDFDRAEVEACRAVGALRHIPALEPFALAVLASVLLGDGRAAEALEPARRAAESAAVTEEGEAMIRLVHAEVLDALGDRAGARRALVAAKERLHDRAGKIASEDRRRSFLMSVIENARTLELSRSLLEMDAEGGGRDGDAS
jgi:tetratricopeptide (TPR) repeat protein